MARGAELVKRIAVAAGALWLLRWAAGEVAAYVGRHVRRAGPPPRASSAVPGLMPIPSDERLRKHSKP